MTIGQTPKTGSTLTAFPTMKKMQAKIDEKEKLYKKIKELENEYSKKGGGDVALLEKINAKKSEYSGIEIKRSSLGKPIFPTLEKTERTSYTSFNELINKLQKDTSKFEKEANIIDKEIKNTYPDSNKKEENKYA